MFNVMLDQLPTEYCGFRIDSDFQTGIMLFQLLQDNELSQQERMGRAIALLFLDEDEGGNPLPMPDFKTGMDGVIWFLSDWNHDNPGKKDSTKVTDYDVDQWRIYAAFRAQYHINLNTDRLHFWEFMGLLSTLEECAFTRVASIRQQKIDPKMDKREKDALREAKKRYALESPEEELTQEEQEAIDAFMKMVKKGR